MDSSGRTTFPILTNSDILKNMKVAKVTLTEGELTNPGRHKEGVRKVFVQLLCICRGESEAELFKIPNRIHSTQANASASPKFKFFALLQKQLHICGYKEFGFKDLTMPQAKRFQSQLSALINFLKYEENKARLLNEALVVMENASDNYTKMQHQLAEARAAHSRGMTERTKVKAEVKQMRAELIEMNKFQASIREKNKHLRKLIKESQHEVKMLSCDLRDEEERELTRASSTKERARQPTMEQANEMLAKKLETKEMLANMLQAQKERIAKDLQSRQKNLDTSRAELLNKINPQQFEGTEAIEQRVNDLRSTAELKDMISKLECLAELWHSNGQVDLAISYRRQL